MTRLTSAQQRATRRAVEQAWQTRYVQRRQAKKALANLDDSVRHPSRRMMTAEQVAAYFNTPAADHLWVSPERREPTPEQQLMHHGEPSPQGIQHIAWEDPAPLNLAATQDYDDVVREALQQVAADVEAREQARARERRRDRITHWCIWTPVVTIWATVLLLRVLGA